LILILTPKKCEGIYVKEVLFPHDFIDFIYVSMPSLLPMGLQALLFGFFALIRVSL
jgi:hypothetical protein